MVLTTLTEWNPWWKTGNVDTELLGMPRKNYDFENYLEFREVKILLGIRRCGKSTLIYQFIDFLLRNNIEPGEILLINFEDDVLSKKTLREIFDVYQSNINPDKKPYVFLDEVHRCKEWVLFLRKMYDTKQVNHVFVTDSCSKFIKPEFASAITGRNITIHVFPLSFKEFLNWKKLSFDLDLLTRTEVNKIRKELKDYLKWGGFPEVFSKTLEINKKMLLTEYISDIIHKDLVERYNINYSKIKDLIDFLCANASNMFSPRKYSKSSGLSLESINTYMKYLQEVFLFRAIPKFDYSVRKQQMSHKKIYIADTGFMNLVGFRFSENIGNVYENAVLIELDRLGKEVYYWKDKYECDFLVKEGAKITQAFQVSFELENKEREVNGLLEALNAFKLKEGLVLTEDFEDVEKISKKTIIYKPLWKWLLSNKKSA